MSEYGNFRRHLGALPFEVVMLGGAVVTFLQGDWKHLAASLFTFAVSFLPLLVERWFRIKLPLSLQAVYVAFVFASLFSGEVLHLYSRIWAWDDGMHLISSLLVGLGVMLWLVVLEKRRTNIKLSPWLGALLVFCTSVSVATLWEIIEFASDELFGTFSQGADLFDTMMDLVYQSMSGLLMAIMWVFHTRNRHAYGISQVIRRFEELNR